MDWRVEARHWWRWGPRDPTIVWSGIGRRAPLAEVEAYCSELERAKRRGPWQAPTGSEASGAQLIGAARPTRQM